MRKILIADDSEPLRKALKDILSSHEGWTICGEAANGRSAVSMAIELKPDLVILDFMMPLMNGLAAAAEISKATPAVPIVLYSMHVNAQIEREAKKAGIRKVVSKIEPVETFVADLEEFLGRGDPPVGPLGITTDTCSGISSIDGLIAKPQTKPPQKPGGNSER